MKSKHPFLCLHILILYVLNVAMFVVFAHDVVNLYNRVDDLQKPELIIQFGPYIEEPKNQLNGVM